MKNVRGNREFRKNTHGRGFLFVEGVFGSIHFSMSLYKEIEKEEEWERENKKKKNRWRSFKEKHENSNINPYFFLAPCCVFFVSA